MFKISDLTAFFSKSRLCICNRIVNLKVPNASTAICQYCYFSIAFICARDYLFRLNYFQKLENRC